MRVSSIRNSRTHRGRSLASLLLTSAIAVSAGATVMFGHPGSAAADPVEDCTATTGAVVAVDFGHWGGGVVRGCDAHPTTGLNLLHNAGFTTAGTEHDGLAFICRLGSSTFGNGVQYPTPAEEPCVNTPQATAYWSFWIAEPGQQTWSYSQFGAGSQQPKPGEVEAWVYGGTDIGGTSGAPSFTPDSVRAKNTAGPSPSSSASPSASASASPTAPATGDPAAAAAWLAGQLVGGDHMENGAFEGPDLPGPPSPPWRSPPRGPRTRRCARSSPSCRRTPTGSSSPTAPAPSRTPGRRPCWPWSPRAPAATPGRSAGVICWPT
ncbi:hypothetical protein ACFQ0T_39240 [Kitasatospora gansuensis]